jgi:3'-phosphoadenosine 5'-phosphosulfate sulfotransferase (PAPS reductase)/FAD synthetase
MRRVRWFSCGAASAVAAKLDIVEHGPGPVVYCDTGAEHPDNARFIADCERWFGCEVETIRSETYADTWSVWEKTRWLNGPAGARCTGELKVAPRVAYQRPGDVQIIGYTEDEKHRAERLSANFFEVDWRYPLIDRGLSKSDCLAMVERAGIELPAMYLLGFRNNNCIGCVKGKAGYWNKIREHFPEVFDRMANLTDELGTKPIELDGERIRLRDLPHGAGRYEAEDVSCSFMCAIAEQDIQ